VNLLLLEPGEIGAGGTATLSDARARHLRTVLAVVPGQPVLVGAIDGALGTGTVTSVDERTVVLSCRLDVDPPPRPAVDLLLALPRPKVMRRLWAQLAALGVGRIMLTNASRVERDYFGTHLLAPASYRPLLIEGLQQARDTRLPEVSIHRQFKVLVEDLLDGLCGPALRIAANPGEAPPLASVVRARAHDRLLLAIGPEGGWNDFERALLEAHGFTAVSMGPRALRTDTAVVALLALAHEALREREHTGRSGTGRT
jgi:RsmE family RNA methyltransferase